MGNVFDQFDAHSAPSQMVGGNVFDRFDASSQPEMQGNDMGAFASGIQGFNSMVPFGNRLTAGAAALTNYPIARLSGSDIGLSDLYDTARENQRATEMAHPTANKVGIAAGFSNSLPLFFEGLGNRAIAGAAAPEAVTNAANTIQEGNAALAGWSGSGNLATRVGKGAVANSAIGAVYGAGQSEDMLQGAKQGAVVGGLVGGGAPVVADAVGGLVNEVKSLVPKNPETSGALRKLAKPLYDAFTQSGGTYSSKLTDEIANLADNAKSTGIAGQTKEADEALNKALGFYSNLRGKTLSPADVQKLDQSLADDIARFNRAGEYNFGRILNDLKYELRARAFSPNNAAGYISGGSPDAVNNLTQANSLWSQSYKAKDIEKLLQKAQGTENPQTSLRTGIKNLLANDKKMANYTDAEKAVLQEAMKRGIAGGGIKLLGSRLIDALIGGTVGFGAGGPVGAVAGAVAGKAAGGLAADAAGAIQANRLRGALSNIQSGMMPSMGGQAALPALSTPASAAAAIERVGLQQTPRSIQQPLHITITPQDAAPEPVTNEQLPQTNDSPLFQRVIQAESSGNQSAISPKGAIGVAQIMPGTAKEAAEAAGLPYDAFRLRTDAEYNAALGEAYLSKLQDKYKNDALALAAYNWGQGNVDIWLRSGANPDKLPRETQGYLKRILGA